MKNIHLVSAFFAATACSSQISSQTVWTLQPISNQSELINSAPQSYTSNTTIQSSGQIALLSQLNSASKNSFLKELGQSITTEFLNSRFQNASKLSIFGVGVNSDSVIGRITFDRYTDQNEILYDGNKVKSFQFIDHQLSDGKGFSLPIMTTQISTNFYPSSSATDGNGAYISYHGVYRHEIFGTGNSPWVSISAPTSDQPASFTLFSSANLSGNNSAGAYIIQTTESNSFSVSANSTQGLIGWKYIEGTTMTLEAENIQTNANIRTTGALFVSKGGPNNIDISDDILAKFSISTSGPATINIENLASNPDASAGITITQANRSNWIGTYSASGNSELYFPGSLIIESRNSGGILLNTINEGHIQDGSIRFAIGSTEVARFTPTSLLVGTMDPQLSSIFTMESTTQGYLPPRMNSYERRQINNPAEGLCLYDTDLKTIVFFNGHNWKRVCAVDVY